MSKLVDILYFPGDDRAEDASEVVKDVTDAAIARASSLLGLNYRVNWISEKEDPGLTVGLRLLERIKRDFDIALLNDQNARDKETLSFLVKSDLAAIQVKYPKANAESLKFIQDTAKSLLEMNVLVPSDSVLDRIRQAGYAYKGATGTLSGKGTPDSINVFIRQKLNSDACVRDFKNVAPRKFKKVNVDMAVFVGCEGVTSDSPHLQGTDYTDVQIVTAKSENIIRAAFQYAKGKGIPKVYVAQKANILKQSDAAFVDYGKKISAETGVEMEYIIFDNFLQRITMNPDRFRVVVTTKFYGDDFLVPLVSAMLDRAESKDLGADVGTFSRFTGNNLDYTQAKIDTRCYRQNSECFYIAKTKGTDTEAINFRRITVEMSENIIRYALDDTLARKKNNLLILYSPFLKGDQIFLDVGRRIARDAKYRSLNVIFMTIADFCWYTLHRPELVDGVVGTNLTMDFLTDSEASKIGGIGMMPSFNYTIETGIVLSEPGHGTAPDLKPDQINPGASLWAMAALLEHMGNDKSGRLNDEQKRLVAKAAELLYEGTTRFYQAGQNLTGDLGGTGSTTDTGNGIKTAMNALS